MIYSIVLITIGPDPEARVMGMTFKNFALMLFCAAVLSACAFPLPVPNPDNTLSGVLQSVGDTNEAESHQGGGGHHH